MKLLHTLFFVLFSVSVLFVSSFAQTQRNPVLEECTGTWCQWCPCGHTVMAQIHSGMPNAILIGYHGASTDPWKVFPGNEIMSAMTFSSYPTAVVDRTSAPISRSLWPSTMDARYNIPATVSIVMEGGYASSNAQFTGVVRVTALTNLTGTFKVSLILLENGLVYPQTGNSSCTGGTDYVHNHVVRSMINGAFGETLNSSGTFNQGEVISKAVQYTLPSVVNADSCDIVAIVYKDATPIYTGEIQQAEQWKLVEITPVELTTFTAKVSKNEVSLSWSTATETNNRGFEVERNSGNGFTTLGFVKGNGTTTQPNSYTYIDRNLQAGAYSYRLKQIDYNGKVEFSRQIKVQKLSPLFSLDQNYPNPFNPTTVITFTVPEKCNGKLAVYDAVGAEVAVLLNGAIEAGRHDITFDASNLSAGLYFYKLQTESNMQVKKLMLLK